MSKKRKFKPIVTRVKLNPEQAVLQCCDAGSKTQVGTTQCNGAINSCNATIISALSS